MNFTVETWDPSYGVAADATELDPTEEAVDASVEVDLDEWAPIAPDAAVAAPPSIMFVDGIRRIDARVWISSDGLVRPGVCATVAAGAVRTSGKVAEVVAAEHQRSLYAMAEGAGPIATRCGTYGLVACAGDSPEDLYLAIHGQMTELERSISAELDDADLIVFDGPLRGRDTAKGVGFVKTQHVQYLEDEQQRVLGRLQAGERSPLFLIGGRFTRWSWYLRLPGPISQPLSGVIRCELPGLGMAVDAAHRASQISAALPRFASEAHKDPRAPQNLYPIAGLERELRRRLGDQSLIERALRVAAHENVDAAASTTG